VSCKQDFFIRIQDSHLFDQDWSRTRKNLSPNTSASQRSAWTGSGLDILQDTCDFFGSGMDLDIYFWKKWIRTGSTGSGYLFDF